MAGANPLGCAAALASLDLLQHNPERYQQFNTRHIPLLEVLAGRPERKILVLNKVDRAKKEPLLALAQEAEVDFTMADKDDVLDD